MSPFSTFVVLYMTAVFLELAEGWEDPVATIVFLVIIGIIVLTRVTRIKFTFFLIFVTAYFLIFRFPDVANHVNLILFCNIIMVVAMVHSFVRDRGRATDDDYFEMIRPVLRATLILVYTLAGLDKLNRDFFNPEVSCAGSILGKLAWIMEKDVFGVPVALVLAAGGLFLVWKLVGGAQFVSSRLRASILIAVLCIGGALFGALVIMVGPQLETLEVILKPTLVLLTAIMVSSWELFGGLLLTVPRFQLAILAFSLTMHAALALVGFVDFGTLALSLLFAFVPSDYVRMLTVPATLPFSGLRIRRVHIYFVINAVGGALSGVDALIYPFFGSLLISGVFFDIAVLVFIWPILSAVFSPSRRPVWGGVRILNSSMPRYMFVFLVALFLFGTTSYLGLRTAGNFSMFSNLRTEGNTSNHFLMRSNPIKIWGYQEDVVRVIEIDDDAGDVVHHYQRPLRGYELPVVEFRKWIYEWTEAGMTVPIKFEYRGEIHSTKDIVNDPVWHTDKRNWEMMLMDFRPIQPGGSNQCRW
jgi:hypothetical protein